MLEIGKITRLGLGYVGEANSRVIEVDVSAWLEQWPDAAIAVIVQRPEEDGFYVAATEVQNGVLSWTVGSYDVGKPGLGMAQFRAYGRPENEDESSRTIYMSRVVGTKINASMAEPDGTQDSTPEDDFIAQVTRASQAASDARDEAIAAQEAAEVAEAAAQVHATNAEASAGAAAGAANVANGAARAASTSADAAEDFADDAAAYAEAANTSNQQAAAHEQAANTSAANAEESARRAEAAANETQYDAGLKAPAIIDTASGAPINISGSVAAPLASLVAYGKTTQNGTPSPSASVTLDTAASSGTLIVASADAGGGAAEYLFVPTPNGLRGVTVASGGDYTDSDGNSWVSDKVSFPDGVITRNIHAVRLTSTSHAWNAGAVAGRFNTNNPSPAMRKNCAPMCTHFVGTATFSALQTGMVCNNDGTQIIFATSFSSLAEWKNFLDNNDVWLIYAMNTGTAKPLSEDVVNTFREMRTKEPETSLFNDAGAWMKVGYVADTKAYIDRLIAAAVGGDA